MKKIICLNIILSISVLFSGCNILKSENRATLQLAKMDATSSDIRYASNIYAELYNENFPLDDSQSIIVAPQNFPQKYIGDYIEKTADIKFIVEKDRFNQIGSIGEYVSKIIFVDDRLCQIQKNEFGGVIETFRSSNDTNAQIKTLKQEIQSEYVYQNGVDLLAISNKLSQKQAIKYQNAFMKLDIGNNLDESNGNIT